MADRSITRLTFATLACAAVAALPVAAAAQDAWPSRPITLVVTYPPGGGADMMARLVAPKMAETLGQSIVVENKPGGAGQVGAGQVARSKPDGYTIMLDGGGYAINPSLYKLPYDTNKAFIPLGITALFPLVVVVTPDYAAKSLPQLIEMAKARPDGISYASPGTGSTQHIAGAMFLQQTKISMVHVPYKGGGPAMADVMGGHVPVFFANIASGLGHIKSGKLRPLGVMSDKRVSALPDVPTLAELGIPNSEAYEWNGVFAPAGVPPAIVARLTDALKKALEAPDVKEKIASLGGQSFIGSPTEVGNFIQDQMQRMGKVVRDGNIKAE